MSEQIWIDRYWRLRNLIERLSMEHRIDHALLALNIGQSERLKHRARAHLVVQLAQGLMAAGALRFQDRQILPEAQLRVVGDLWAIRDREALAQLDNETKHPSVAYPFTQDLKEVNDGNNQPKEG